MKKVEEWLNCTTHESTGFTPHELIRGTRPPRILERLFTYPPEGQVLDQNMKIRLANENLLTRGERRKQKHDAKGKWTKYEAVSYTHLNWYVWPLSTVQIIQVLIFFYILFCDYNIFFFHQGIDESPSGVTLFSTHLQESFAGPPTNLTISCHYSLLTPSYSCATTKIIYGNINITILSCMMYSQLIKYNFCFN